MGFLEDQIDESLRVQREFEDKPRPRITIGGAAYLRDGLIGGLNNLARDYRKENDKWWRDVSTGEKLVANRDQKLLLIVGEIIEAHEGLRKGTMDKHLPNRKTECVELADALIRMLDYIGEYHPDFGEAVVEKLEYNKTRQDHTAAARLAPGGKKF